MMIYVYLSTIILIIITVLILAFCKKLPVLLAFILTAGMISFVCIFISSCGFKRFNVDFATKVHLKYDYGDAKIDVVITDEDDVKALKKMFNNEISYVDGLLATMFDTSMSLTFIGENNESVVVLPSPDFTYFRLDAYVDKNGNWTFRYIDISSKDILKLREIVRRYGVILD